MTTPRDDIAGLSERLRAEIDQPLAYRNDTTLREAATQLDSLLKERDALQARVKELEARPPLLDAKSIPRVDALVRTLEDRATRLQQERDQALACCDSYVNENQQLHDRMEKAQQERDEAVTATRYKIFDNLLGVYIGAGSEQLRVAIGNFAFMIFPEYRDELRKAHEDIRRLAGPEKEGE